jgi:hypothetical protein
MIQTNGLGSGHSGQSEKASLKSNNSVSTECFSRLNGYQSHELARKGRLRWKTIK